MIEGEDICRFGTFDCRFETSLLTGTTCVVIM